MIDIIEKLMGENDKLSVLLKQSLANNYNKHAIHSESDIGPILQQVISSIERNSGKVPKQRRHSTISKKFGIVLYIYAGSMAYQFLHSNMPQVLPSLRTVQHAIQVQYSHIEEGKFRFDDLLQHLAKHREPFVVAIAEDATHIIKKVEYDPSTNRCVGFVLPSDQNGLPLSNTFLATSFEGIETMFANSSIAKYAYVYVAQPLKDGIPSFCLACVGSDNKFTAKEIMQRWEYIYGELSLRGIHITSFSSDGDTRLLKSMRISQGYSTDPALPQFKNKSRSTELPKAIQHWLCVKVSLQILFLCTGYCAHWS